MDDDVATHVAANDRSAVQAHNAAHAGMASDAGVAQRHVLHLGTAVYPAEEALIAIH